MNVLSLFDGISCGRIALERVGIKVDNYFASEIKEDALKVSKDNWKDIIQLGDVRNIRTTELSKLPKIDLLLFGSPCQDLSNAMKNRKGLTGSKSVLFYEALRILREIKPTYFLMENVATMKKEDRDIISKELGVEPILINSSLVSAQLRKRLYWTNIPNVNLPKDKEILLKNIITSGFVNKSKSRTINVSEARPVVNKEKLVRRYKTTGMVTLVFEDKDFSTKSARIFNQTELERLQTLPEGYTKCLDRNSAAGVIGDGWTIDVIAHILSKLKVMEVKQEAMQSEAPFLPSLKSWVSCLILYDDDLMVLCDDCHNNAHADLHLGTVSNPYCPMCNARMTQRGNMMVCVCGTTIEPKR
jgi:DNA (cytosine-5)-methyltransferase 3A